MKCCGNCQYWNNDTGFCSVKMIPTLRNESCEMWEKEKIIRGDKMSKRFHATQVNPFKITDNWLNRELTNINEVIDTMNDQEEHIRLLQKANENISRAGYEISSILEDGGVILTKEQLNEIINEGAYRKKVKMTNDKRYRTESIEGLTSWFIVDELSAKKKSDKITSFKAYDTHSKRKCDELTDLLNNYVEENEQLKSDIILIEKRADTVYDEIEQIKKDLKVVLPVLLAIDFKMSVNECEVMNRLAELLDDDFVKGVECE